MNEIRKDWAFASQFYWAKAYFALSGRDYDLMRAVAAQAEKAELHASPDGALAGAIFGGIPECLDEAAIASGKTLPEADVKSARSVVKAEIARHQAQFSARLEKERDEALKNFAVGAVVTGDYCGRVNIRYGVSAYPDVDSIRPEEGKQYRITAVRWAGGKTYVFLEKI
jgi:hypothetical protein